MVFFKDNRNLNKLGKRTKLEINVFALNIDFINLKRKKQREFIGIKSEIVGINLLKGINCKLDL